MIVSRLRKAVITVLTSEEDSLEAYLVHMAEYGFPLTRTMVSGGGSCFHPEYGPRDHWWSLFKKHHPKLTLHNLESRAEALNPGIVSKYFDILHKSLQSNRLLTSPREIFNCDETFLPSEKKVVATRGAKNVYRQTHGTTDHIT